MQISAKEPRQPAGDYDDTVHHGAAASRRSFLRGAGLAGVGGTLLATAGGVSTLTRLGGIAGAQAEVNDPLLAAYAQSIELTIVEVYAAMGPQAPAELQPLVTLFSDHHQAHADALGDLAGDAVQVEGNAVLLAQLEPALKDVEDGTPGVELTSNILQVMTELENQSVYTYVAAIGLLKDPAYSELMSSILPINAQHATVLAITAGRGPEGWFPTGAFESALVGDGSDPLRGFDPNTFVTG